jgi:nucleoside-diphosphate-sugar epimerase
VSLYARTKIDSERVLLQLNDDTFSPVILRFGTIYGMSPRPRFDLVVNTLVAHAVKEKQITIFGGEQWRPFVHVDDVAEGIIVALEAPIAAVKGQTFNVGSDDENYRIRELGELIKGHIPDVDVIQQGDDVDLRNYRVSFEKIRKHLGYRPRYTVSDGIVELRAALEAGRVANYQDIRFNNVRALSEEGGSLLVRQTVMTPLYSLGDTSIQDEPAVLPAPGAATP